MKKIIILASTLLLTTICYAADDNQSTSESTINEWHKTRFAQLDADNNGSLNVSELRVANEGWMTKAEYSEEQKVKQAKKKFTRVDNNKDQKISLQEFSDDLNNTKKNKKKNKKKNS